MASLRIMGRFSCATRMSSTLSPRKVLPWYTVASSMGSTRSRKNSVSYFFSSVLQCASVSPAEKRSVLSGSWVPLAFASRRYLLSTVHKPLMSRVEMASYSSLPPWLTLLLRQRPSGRISEPTLDTCVSTSRPKGPSTAQKSVRQALGIFMDSLPTSSRMSFSSLSCSFCCCCLCTLCCSSPACALWACSSALGAECVRMPCAPPTRSERSAGDTERSGSMRLTQSEKKEHG